MTSTPTNSPPDDDEVLSLRQKLNTLESDKGALEAALGGADASTPCEAVAAGPATNKYQAFTEAEQRSLMVALQTQISAVESQLATCRQQQAGSAVVSRPQTPPQRASRVSWTRLVTLIQWVLLIILRNRYVGKKMTQVVTSRVWPTFLRQSLLLLRQSARLRIVNGRWIGQTMRHVAGSALR